jgi:hypothetical protein
MHYDDLDFRDYQPDPRLQYRDGYMLAAEREVYKLLRRGLRGDDLDAELARAKVPALLSRAIIARWAARA